MLFRSRTERFVSRRFWWVPRKGRWPAPTEELFDVPLISSSTSTGFARDVVDGGGESGKPMGAPGRARRKRRERQRTRSWSKTLRVLSSHIASLRSFARRTGVGRCEEGKAERVGLVGEHRAQVGW